MKPLETFTDQPYLNLETYRRNGEALRTPVWFVRANDRLYIRTVAGSGKVKRIANQPSVRIALCTVNGELSGPWIAARARELQADPELDARIDRLLEDKYGALKRELAERAAREGRVYTLLELSA
jgi:hypothetical protein